jgi:phage shock protein C
MQENADFQEIKETKKAQGNFFEVPGVLKAEYTEKSGAKPEKKPEGKAAEEPAEKIEGKVAEKAGEAIEKVRGEAKQETKQEAKQEAKQEPKQEAKQETTQETTQEAKQEPREEKRTIYTMEKRLTKSKTDRKLFGVCGGLGEYFGIDPTLVRLAFVVLTLFEGLGLVLYIILAIIMPSEMDVEMVPSSQSSIPRK